MENESKKHIKTIKALIGQKKELEKTTEKMQKQELGVLLSDHLRNNKKKKKPFRKEKGHSSIKINQEGRFSYLPKRSSSSNANPNNNFSQFKKSTTKDRPKKVKKETGEILQTILKSKSNKNNYIKNALGDAQLKSSNTPKAKEMKKITPKRRNKSPQQLYDALNRKSYSVSIKQYKNTKFAPEPFKPKQEEVEIFESQSVQTPISMKRGSKTLTDRIDYYHLIKNSKLKRRLFNLWLSKWSRSEIQNLRKELKLAIENKKVEVSKKSKKSSSDSDDLPPLYDDNL